MPLAYLLVQASDEAYVERLGKAMAERDPTLLEKFSNRMVAITRSAADSEDTKDMVLNTFDPDDDEHIFKIADLRKCKLRSL